MERRQQQKQQQLGLGCSPSSLSAPHQRLRHGSCYRNNKNASSSPSRTLFFLLVCCPVLLLLPFISLASSDTKVSGGTLDLKPTSAPTNKQCALLFLQKEVKRGYPIQAKYSFREAETAQQKYSQQSFPSLRQPIFGGHSYAASGKYRGLEIRPQRETYLGAHKTPGPDTMYAASEYVKGKTAKVSSPTKVIMPFEEEVQESEALRIFMGIAELMRPAGDPVTLKKGQHDHLLVSGSDENPIMKHLHIDESKKLADTLSIASLSDVDSAKAKDLKAVCGKQEISEKNGFLITGFHCKISKERAQCYKEIKSTLDDIRKQYTVAREKGGAFVGRTPQFRVKKIEGAKEREQLMRDYFKTIHPDNKLDSEIDLIIRSLHLPDMEMKVAEEFVVKDGKEYILRGEILPFAEELAEGKFEMKFDSTSKNVFSDPLTKRDPYNKDNFAWVSMAHADLLLKAQGVGVPEATIAKKQDFQKQLPQSTNNAKDKVKDNQDDKKADNKVDAAKKEEEGGLLNDWKVAGVVGVVATVVLTGVLYMGWKMFNKNNNNSLRKEVVHTKGFGWEDEGVVDGPGAQDEKVSTPVEAAPDIDGILKENGDVPPQDIDSGADEATVPEEDNDEGFFEMEDSAMSNSSEVVDEPEAGQRR